MLPNGFLTLCSSKPIIFNFTTDQNALIAFKNAISDNPNGILTKNWSTNAPVCNWIGVSCGSKHQRVTALNVSGLELKGTIAPHLGNLTFLRSLDISSNNFTGPIPSELSKLRRLKAINLASNQLTGSTPNVMFNNISSLVKINMEDNRLSGGLPNDICTSSSPKLQRIYLSGNQLEGEIPANIHKCTELEDLRLDNNRFNGSIPTQIRSLPNLRILSLFPPSIFNISTLAVLTLQQNLFSGTLPTDMGLSLFSLEELVLSFNRLTGEIPTSITNASKLTKLELNRNSFSGSIPNFGTLRNLQFLRLWENNLTQGMEFLSSLTNCQYLQVLEIYDNPLNGILPTSVGNLSTDSLVRFLASDCKIQGIIPSEIGNLKSLQTLDLSGNQLSGFIPSTMGELKQLYTLALGGNRLRGYIPRYLCQLSNLGVLYLYDNMLTGPIPDCIGELTSLADLSVNSFGGPLSPHIGNLKSLNNLDLSHNQFTGDIPSSIGGCQSLQSLNLSNNNFRGSIPESLGNNVRGLGTLNLSNNSLSGSIPKSLENVRGLQNFDVSYNELDGEIPNGGPFGNFSAQSFAHNSALCGEARFEVLTCPKSHERSRSTRIAQITKYVVPTFISVIIFVAVVVILIRRRKRRIKTPPPSEISLKTTACRRISYFELDRGTSSFSETNLLGRGSFGSVFKATLSDGLDIAVKVFNLQLEGGIKSFDTETNTEFKALILEYMQNGSLEKWLHSDNYCLDLVQRLSIAMDVALALEYLHHGHTFPVVHCDIKPSNVLLDEEMIAHVGDFGISKLFDEGETMIQTKTLATIGYAAPEYGSEGKVSTNGDVYSYGIMLLEMFTRKRPTDDMFSADMSLKEWVAENSVSEVVAPGLLSREDQHFSAHELCVSSVFDLAMKCLAFSPDERINMIQVVAALHKVRSNLIAATEVIIMRRPPVVIINNNA
ncbi:probable LRR receptor-like serine/threonine-protein kinase at3g47570 [Phtheirospermum japonicum]|uniref:non-specific serine/threonine protein kinase n=1 Tax=Phtheirospermum japonicum TaxID=374723 RepID=A0A830B8Q4_9LAMI|nr:probable LRR receptor-like serine/threonine-protein kinase at3g47570 [Phtheirospermum japonicum]